MKQFDVVEHPPQGKDKDGKPQTRPLGATLTVNDGVDVGQLQESLRCGRFKLVPADQAAAPAAQDPDKKS